MPKSTDTNLKKHPLKPGSADDDDDGNPGIFNCLYQYIKSNKIIVSMAVLFVVAISIFTLIFVLKYYYQSGNITYKPDGRITALPQIQRRSLDTPGTYDIGILVIVSADANMTEYELALDTLQCYSKLHNYGFNIEWVNDTWKEKCPQTNFMFLRHCITSHLLHRHEWTLFLDADVGVANPSKLIDTFVEQNENEADIVFFDRFFNQEIAAGSYLAKNSSYSKEFLMKFANAEVSMPKKACGTDNGAIHWLFVKEFFSHEPTTSKYSADDCYNLWSISTTFPELFVFEACCRIIMGEKRLLHNPNGTGSVKIIPKGEAWMRDVWLIQNKWSTDSDFMLHGWKKSAQLPDTNPSIFRWYPVTATPSFDLDSCSNGTIEWQLWSSYMITKSERENLLMKKREEVNNEYSKYESLIPIYLKKFY